MTNAIIHIHSKPFAVVALATMGANGRGIVAGESSGFCFSAKDAFWITRNTGFPCYNPMLDAVPADCKIKKMNSNNDYGNPIPRPLRCNRQGLEFSKI
jgi:hypothetical protein